MRILYLVQITTAPTASQFNLYYSLDCSQDAEKLAWLLWFCLGSIFHQFLWMMCMLMATWAEYETKKVNPWLDHYEHYFSSDPVFDFVGHLITLG